MSHQPFEFLDVKNISVSKPKANEYSQGKSAWVNVEEGPKLFTIKNAELLWPIRPGAEGDVKATDRLNIEIKVNPAEEAKARECDQKFIKALFENKTEFFGNKAKNITMIESLLPMYKPLLREGSMGKDGTPYANSIRLKVDGCGSLIKKVNVSEIVKGDGEKIKVVKDCTWNDRIVDENEENAPGARDTRFFLFKGMSPASGKPMYTNKVVALDSSGNPISKGMKDGKPNFVMRFVGPQDALPGCTLTIVWQLSKLYLTETTGPTSVAKDIYIKPKIKKVADVNRVLDDVEVVDANAEESLELLKSMLPDEESQVKNEETVQEPVIEPKKRKTDSVERSSKKTKAAVVEEDF